MSGAETHHVHPGGLPVVSARSIAFTIAGDDDDDDDDDGSCQGAPTPSIVDLLAKLEHDELLHLEMDDRARLEDKLRSRRHVAQVSDTTHSTQYSTLKTEPNDDVDCGSGQHIASRETMSTRLEEDCRTPEAQQPRGSVEASLPSIKEMLQRIDGSVSSAASNMEGGASEYQPQLNFSALANRGWHHDPQQLRDMRDNFNAKFQEADSGLLQGSAARIARRPPIEPLPETCALDDKGHDDPESWSQYMQDLLRGGPEKKPSPPRGTEQLPGVPLAGLKASLKKKAKAPTNPKRAEELRKMLRHANAGGSLETLFEEDNDPDAMIPECDLLFGGRSLQCATVPQVFMCVSDGQRSDWAHLPKR